MNDEYAIELANKTKWTFAKTYADKSPHEYIVIKIDTPNRDELNSFVDFIKTNGETELYYGRPFTVYKVGGHKYWYAYTTNDHTTPDILNRSLYGEADRKYR